MKRCRGEEEKKNIDNNNKSSSKKKSKLGSDLNLDVLGEIKKRLFWAAHIRFGAVCKTWMAAQHEKRAADVLPWLMVLYRTNISKLSCYLYEPSAPHLSPMFSHVIHLDHFFDISRIQNSMSIIYLYGCVFVSMYDTYSTCSYSLVFSLATKKATALPQFNLPVVSTMRFFKLLKAVSTNPTCPDCVFLALYIANDHERAIGIFRHGDTQWTTTQSSGGWFGFPCVDDVVFIRGVFYFLFKGGQLGSYDIATGELKFDHSQQCTTQLRNIHKFFGLDGELMVKYYDAKARKICIRSYDWSHKVWVPLKSLGNRSLFFSRHSVYVDEINYYGVSSNMIYDRKDRTCYVYSLQNGELFECTSSGLRNWDALDFEIESVWVEPPDLLPKLGTSL